MLTAITRWPTGDPETRGDLRSSAGTCPGPLPLSALLAQAGDSGHPHKLRVMTLNCQFSQLLCLNSQEAMGLLFHCKINLSCSGILSMRCV